MPTEKKYDDIINKISDYFKQQLTLNGKDLSDNMEIAISKLEKLIENEHFDLAILKSKSPSCGYKNIYDGTFSKKIVEGNGFACECLLRHNIKILTELDF